MILRRNLSILIVKKKNKLEEFKKVAGYLKYNNISFFFEDDDSERIMHSSSSKENNEQNLDKDYITPDELKSQTKNPIDLVISLGGDGTVLRISSLFPWKVPPVVSFNLGTLGFLPAFSFSQFTGVLDKLLPIFKEMKRYQQLDSLNQRNIAPFSLLNRMRLSCSLINSLNGERKQSDFQIMNEVTVHRGHNVQLGHIDTFVNDNYLTDAMADGLIVSTPTGSTAYSLSAGGPIVHPTVSSMVLTPICPRSLSFRSLVLPPHVTIRMKLSDKARGDALVSADGKNIFQLSPGFTLEIRRSLFSIPCIQTGNSEWMDGIVNQLRWNQSFKNNGM